MLSQKGEDGGKKNKNSNKQKVYLGFWTVGTEVAEVESPSPGQARP